MRCTRLGADPDLTMEVLGNSSGQSAALIRSGPRMLSQNFNEDVLPLRMVLKDISLAQEMALEVGVNLPAAQDALKMFQVAADQGLEELDASSIIVTLQGLAGLELSKREKRP